MQLMLFVRYICYSFGHYLLFIYFFLYFFSRRVCRVQLILFVVIRLCASFVIHFGFVKYNSFTNSHDICNIIVDLWYTVPTPVPTAVATSTATAARYSSRRRRTATFPLSINSSRRLSQRPRRHG